MGWELFSSIVFRYFLVKWPLLMGKRDRRYGTAGRDGGDGIFTFDEPEIITHPTILGLVYSL